MNDAAFEALAAAVKLGETTDGLFYSGFVKDDPNAIGDVNISEVLFILNLLSETRFSNRFHS